MCTLLAEPFISIERLYGSHVNFLLILRITIFTQIFKAGLASVRHMPAESFLDTSKKIFSKTKRFLVSCSKEIFLEMAHIG